MKEVYLISGLGADKRVFDFLDLSNWKVNYIEWMAPNPCETIQSYAGRLLNQIDSQHPVIIGVSFGGMMAIEIAKLRTPEKVILISSARTKNDIPTLYRIMGLLRLTRILPARLLKSVNPLTYWVFGVKRPEERALLRQIIFDTDDTFLKWAIDQITNWKNETFIKNTFTIHGNQDRILPGREPDFKIEKGGHLMIINRSAEINSILRNLLA